MADNIAPSVYWKQEPIWVRFLKSTALVNFFIFVAAMGAWGLPFDHVALPDGTYSFLNHGHSLVITAKQHQFLLWETSFTVAITVVAIVAWFWALVKKHEYA